jgi:hypothetical protein
MHPGQWIAALAHGRIWHAAEALRLCSDSVRLQSYLYREDEVGGMGARDPQLPSLPCANCGAAIAERSGRRDLIL